MIIAQYFVEFIFYSFLGWVWESIYCTIKNKEWADRGFLFGPVCPIYGSCVVAASLVFSLIEPLQSPDFPVWGIFLICMVGSAIAEFGTSWVLEKRFHAMWWDYSKMPFNIQGRICLPISIAFGLAGIVVVKYLIPAVSNMHTEVNPLLYEGLAIIFGMLFGADFALTEASLSSLLQDIESYKADWNRKAENTYHSIAATPRRIEISMAFARESVAESVSSAKESFADGVHSAKETVAGGLSNAKETVADGLGNAKDNVSDNTERLRSLADSYTARMSFNQKRIFGSIARFKTSDEEDETKKVSGLSMTEHLKNSLKFKRKH